MLTVSGPPGLNVRNDPDQQFKYTANCRILQEQGEKEYREHPETFVALESIRQGSP
jgi:hypothetical protein